MSANYAIFSDSTLDLPAETAERFNIHIIPYIYTLDGKDYHNYLDYRELPAHDFYQAMREGKLGTTAQVSAHRYLESWKPFLEDGTDVLHLCLSSKLSKSYEQSILAAREAAEAYPGRKVITVDSKQASLGQGFLATYVAKAKNAGKTLDEAAEILKEAVRKIQLWAMVDDLNHLKRGGRISGAKAAIGTILNVKPIITILDDGTLVNYGKARGRNKALSLFVEYMEKYAYVKDEPVYIAHSDIPELAEQLKQMVNEKYGITDFLINDVGPVIGSHTGPGTIALVFLGQTERVKE